jgi:hypothetical protein
MISSNLKVKRSGPTNFFPEICDSCAKELKTLGFECEVILIPGGVGVKFTGHQSGLPSIEKLTHLPILELDFSGINEFPEDQIQLFNLSGIALPRQSGCPFSTFKEFELSRFRAVHSLAHDFDSLECHPLLELDLSGSALSNLSFCRDMPLTKLDISSTSVQDISSLQKTALNTLNLSKTKIKNLTGLEALPLQSLDLTASEVDQLEPIKGLPLHSLSLRATQVSDLTPLMDSPIDTLELPGSRVRSIRPLSYCPIRCLNMIGIPVEDLSPLLEMQLESLYLSPLKLNREDFDILAKIKVQYLIGPGDPVDQSPEQFFKKYLKLLDI